MGDLFAEQLAELLNGATRETPDGIPPLEGWRFEVAEGSQLQAGIVDNKLGSVYSPPSVRQQVGGGVYLRWSDGLVSQGNVERRTIAEFADRLATWRRNAYRDPNAPGLWAPEPIPEVQVYDPTVADLLGGEVGFALEILRRADREIRAFDVRFLDAGVSAGRAERTVANSRGLSARTEQTSFGFWLAADSLYSNGYGKRRLIPEEEAERIIADVGETSRRLRRTGRLASGDLPVILAPRVAAGFIGMYLVRNLSGSLVANRQSVHSLDDFKSGKAVIRPDLRLEVNSLVPWELATESCTSEGVPGGVAVAVEAGRLVRPLCDLKYAAITGFPPTPGGQVYLYSDRIQLFPRLIETVGDGLLVHQVLGMHTQDPASGNYSVTAEQALVVRNGQVEGKVKAVIAGNFFENLLADETAFGTDPHEPNPGVRLRCRVTVEA
ncbi:MAG: hypothetical protein HY331_02125 [Chloroflexi bacterium]|nr:hypothetical protein [Chloroflexota bacterium]